MKTRTDNSAAAIRREAGTSRSLLWSAAAGVLAVAGIIALSATRADAQSVGELQGRIDAAQGDAGSLEAQIDEGNAQLASAQSAAASAAARETALTAMLAEGEQLEAELNGKVDEAERRLESARARLHRALDALADRLVAIYKGESIDEAAVLLNADGYDDLTTRATLLRRIQEADQALAERVRALRAAVADRLAAVEEARDAQAAHNDQVAAARDQMSAARAEAEQQAAAVEAARDQQAAALASLQSQIAGWSDQVQEARAAAAAEAAAAAAAAAAPAQPTSSGPWSIPGYIVACESGGNYGAVNPGSGAGGAYQILPSTWALYGGQGLPQNGSPAEQDQIAAQIWADSGGSAWVCAG